jgi:hypothetical protein
LRLTDAVTENVDDCVITVGAEEGDGATAVSEEDTLGENVNALREGVFDEHGDAE